MTTDNNDSSTLADRLRGFRDRIEQKTTQIRADKRAKARRIELEEPDTVGEKVAVKRRRLGEARDEFGALADESKGLVEERFGVDIDAGESGGTIGDFASRAGEALDNLDPEALEEDMDPLGDGGDMMMDPASEDVDPLGGEFDEAVDADFDPADVSDPVMDPGDDLF